MNRGIEPAGATPAAGPPPAETKQADLDLDRLVWDPEYRDAMRSLMKPGA
ncbi:MAG: hypothetical protein RLN99_05985 [Kiloniellaceae bacterium]